MEISNELMFNIIKDFEKKTISTQEKGEFIRLYLKENNMSQRAFAKLLGVPYSTLHDWISNRQMLKYYKNKDLKLEEQNNEDNQDGVYDMSLLKINNKELRKNLYSLLDRVVFVLSKRDKLDDKEYKKLCELEDEIFKIKIKNKRC